MVGELGDEMGILSRWVLGLKTKRMRAGCRVNAMLLGGTWMALRCMLDSA